MRGKKREKIFSRNKRISRAKNDAKKSSGKSAKTCFLYTHEYRHQKMGGKKREKKFFQKHTNRLCEKCWKIIVSKKCEKMFFNKHINIVTKNGGKKARKFFFQKHMYIASKKDGKKSSGKSAKTRFFINTRIS